MARTYPGKDAIVHWVSGQQPVRWSFSGLVAAAERYSAAFMAKGVKEGDVCAIILKHHPDFYPVYLAVCLLGAVPAVLAYPNPRLHPEKFSHGIEGMLERSGLDWVITEPRLSTVLAPFLNGARAGLKGVLSPAGWRTLPEPGPEHGKKLSGILSGIGAGSPVLLQHSSGTTGLQKPVLLAHGTVLEHLDRYAEAIRLRDGDKVVSWLPLYHDMGLIAAFHLPLAFGIPSVQLDPFEWVVAPSIFFEAVSKEGGTLAWLPNFAFNLSAQKIHDEEMEGVSLKTLRMVVNSSEAVREESHQAFLKRFKRYGLRPGAISTAYAMAETTFAVTQSAPEEYPLSITADRKELARGRVKLTPDGAAARVCVSSGRPIPGCSIRILDGKGRKLSEGRVGDIAVKSASLFEGYRNYPEKTKAVLKDGWYHSGDRGFLHRGHCFVTGRKKDLIIVGGNNIHPEDVEAEVGRVPGVLPGRVVAYGEEDPRLGTEQVCVIAEADASKGIDPATLKKEIVQAAMKIDVTIKDVHLVPPRWIIKSSSGKVSRQANKERIRHA